MNNGIGLVALVPKNNGRSARSSKSVLVEALGWKQDNGDKTYLPDIAYIQSYWPGKGSKEDYLQLFADTVNFFKAHATDDIQPSIQSYIDSLVRDRQHFYFSDSLASSEVREMAMENTVLLILGLWTLMRSYFVPLHGHTTHILSVYATRVVQHPLAQPLPSFVSGSELLPSPKEAPPTEELDRPTNEEGDSPALPLFALHSSLDLIGSLAISSKDMNLFKLTTLARVQILWTDNISRHLLLSRRGQNRYIELFGLPCTLQSGANDVLRGAGISSALMDEITVSYANLFNPKPPSKFHKYAGRFIGIQTGAGV
ncbi:hypothetical protein F5Y08DRAFT_345216 [Xylaria arbuscula]|nr:hypothetical protein F5Y08DRAFT_345216 [Xylaria arbuscula]